MKNKFELITQKDVQSKGVQALSDRPNKNGQYGIGGLSAKDLKLWFDKLSTFLVEKQNEIRARLDEEVATTYIALPDAFVNKDFVSLYDLLVGIVSDAFAHELIVKLTTYPEKNPAPDSKGVWKYPLDDALNRTLELIKSDGESNKAEFNRLWAELAHSLFARKEYGSTSSPTSFANPRFDFLLKNRQGDTISKVELPLDIRSADIPDGILTERMYEDESITSDKIRHLAVNNDKLADGAVSKLKLDAGLNNFIDDMEKHKSDPLAHESLFEEAVNSADSTARNYVSYHNRAVDAHANLLGLAILATDKKTVKEAINEVYYKGKITDVRSVNNNNRILALEAQAQGIARTFVVEDFQALLNFMHSEAPIKYYKPADDNPSGPIIEVDVYVSDLRTGDNILLREKDVADFWFEKTPEVNPNPPTYKYKGTKYELNCVYSGELVGYLYILETDYNIIDGKVQSASKYAEEAEASAVRAQNSATNAQTSANTATDAKNKVVSMYYSLFNVQTAPPLSVISKSRLLSAPTLAQIAADQT